MYVYSLNNQRYTKISIHIIWMTKIGSIQYFPRKQSKLFHICKVKKKGFWLGGILKSKKNDNGSYFWLRYVESDWHCGVAFKLFIVIVEPISNSLNACLMFTNRRVTIFFFSSSLSSQIQTQGLHDKETITDIKIIIILILLRYKCSKLKCIF